MANDFTWAPLAGSDLDRLCQTAQAIHPDLPERPEVFAEKIRLFPAGCRKLVRQGRFVGYGLAHPWHRDAVPPLDTLLLRLPTPAECLYVHDIALLPEARGAGASVRYLGYLADLALGLGLSALALTSVYGTDVLWRRHGFTQVTTPTLEQKLRSYGASAKYLRRKLRPQ